MGRRPEEFIKPEPQRKHGLSPMTFQATRLSHFASMAFGCALIGDADGVVHACAKAQVALDRMTGQIRKEAHE